MSNTAKDKAERLRKLRNYANLSREALCEIANISINTYKGWEIGRLGGITESGAKTIIETVHKCNVNADIDWLLNGTGDEPYIVPTNKHIKTFDRDIEQELTLFKLIYKKILYFEITEQTKIDCPFSPSDVVAGRKSDNTNEYSLENNYCIILTIDNQLLLGKIIKILGKNSLIVGSISDNKTFTVEIKEIAIVSRHYKLIRTLE